MLFEATLRLITQSMREYRSTWWAIDLVAGWSADQLPECTSFSRDDGVGVLQISGYKQAEGRIPTAAVLEFMDGKFQKAYPLNLLSVVSSQVSVSST